MFTCNLKMNYSSAGDRFIPSRRSSNFHLLHHELILKSTNNNVEENSAETAFSNTARKIYRQNNYIKCLSNIMLPNINNRFLNFSTIPSTNNKIEKDLSNVPILWPIKSRPKPLLNPPITILDMPNLETDLRLNVVDWSAKGYMATIYMEGIHIWHSNFEKVFRISDHLGPLGKYIKWDKTGEILAASMRQKEMYLININTQQAITSFKCYCKGGLSRCEITAFEFSPSNRLIVGCANGSITFFDANQKILKCINYSRTQITNLKLSCNGQYMAVCSSVGKLEIFAINNNSYVKIASEVSTKAVSWHPWKEPILVYGNNSSLYLYNFRIKKVIEIYDFPYSCHLDYLTFNPVSAELVVSCYRYLPKGHVNFISVLKNFNITLDEVRMHSGRVPYLLWNHDGTQLASCGVDENLCIWDFFGNAPKKEYFELVAEKIKRSSPSSINESYSFIR